MPIEIRYQPNDVFVLRISGTLKQSEFDAEQRAIAGKIETGSNLVCSPFLKILRVGNVALIGMISTL